jgi:hypothetical protein
VNAGTNEAVRKPREHATTPQQPTNWGVTVALLVVTLMLMGYGIINGNVFETYHNASNF